MKQYLDYVLDGRPVEVGASEREAWEARNPKAERARRFLLPDGSQTLVRESRQAAFDAEHGGDGSEELFRLDGDDGRPYRVRASRLRDWTRDQTGGGGSVALAAAKGAAEGLWQGAKDVPKAVGEMGMSLAGAAADIATAAPRVTGHVAGAVAEHLPEGGAKDYLEAVRDAGRGPVGTLGGLSDALRAPLTDNAGTRQVARPLMDLGGTIAKFSLLGPAAAPVMGTEGAAGAMDRAVANGKSETRAVLAGAPAGAAEAFVFSGANPTARLAAGAFRPAAAATVRGAQARTLAGAALRGAVHGAESETAKGLAAGDLSAGGVARSAAEMALVSGAHTALGTFGRFQDAARAEREGREAARAEAVRRASERNAAFEEARSAMEERTVREGEDPALYDRIGEWLDREEAARAARPAEEPPAAAGETPPPAPAAAPPPPEAPEAAPPRLAPEAMAEADAAANARSRERKAVVDSGLANLRASRNVPADTKPDARTVVYTPEDGTGAFKITAKSFSHGLRGAERADNMLVGAHIGEALDASLALPERTRDARFRMAAVTLDGEPAHVLFTIVNDGGVRWEVLKGYNTKGVAAKGQIPTAPAPELGERTFTATPGTLAQLEAVWQAQFKPGIERHNARKGRVTEWTRAPAPAAAPPAPDAAPPLLPPAPSPEPAPATVNPPQVSATERIDRALSDLAASKGEAGDAIAAIDRHAAALQAFEKGLRSVPEAELRAMLDARPDPGKGYRSSQAEWDLHSVLNSVKDEISRRESIAAWDGRDRKGETTVDLGGGVAGVLTRVGGDGSAWFVRTPRNGLNIGAGKTKATALANAKDNLAAFEKRQGANANARALFDEGESRPWERSAASPQQELDAAPPRLAPEAMAEADTAASAAAAAPSAPPAVPGGAEGAPRADPSTGGAAFASPIPRGVFDSAIAEASAAVEGIRSKAAAAKTPAGRLKALLARDAKAGGALPDAAKAEYRAVADEAAKAGLYRTAALARARIGEMKGMPAESRAGAEGPDAAARSDAAATPEALRLFAEAEGGAPALQRLGVGELVGVARQLLGGQLPGVRRILKGGAAAGLFRPGEAAAARFGMRDSGSRRAVEILSKLYQALPEGERARIEADAARAAASETGAAAGEAFEAAKARWHAKLFEEAWHRSLKDGPQAAARALAHEIGHLVDFLPGRSADDHALRRGNVLGHIAGLSRYMRSRLSFDPAAHFTAEREAGRETLRGEDAILPPKERAAIAKAAREAVERAKGESVEAWEARRAKAGRDAVAEEGLRRGLAGRPEVEAELRDLVAWYNTSDGCPEYYGRNAAELFAEAFGAAVNYPEIARVKAPRFMKLMDGWIEANPEAARALAEARRRAGALEAKAIRTGRSQPDEAFFGELRGVTAAQTEARRRIGEILRAKGRQTVEEANDFMRAWFVGRFEPVWKRIRRHGGWTREASAKAWGSLNRLSHWANGGDIMAYRWRSEVAPLVAKVKGGQEAFDEFLINWRVANEALGEGRTGGRVNLANPLGLTPGDFTGPGAEAGRTAAARLKSIAERDPEQWAALLAAREAFWKMRTDRESSVLQMLRRSGLMPEEVLRQLEANSAYVRFRRGVSARDYGPRELSKARGAEMSTWSGVFRQVSGMHDAVESPTLATLLGDMEIYRRAALNEARRDVANFLLKELPGEVRPSTAFRFERGRGVVPVQTEDAHRRTLVWVENGKAKALEVPKAVADALGDDAIGLGLERSAALVQGVRAFARCESALMTAWNYSFAAKNVIRDKADMARAMPGRAWDTTGGVLANVLGDFGAAARAAANGAGRNRRLGISDERVLRALETGAMPAGAGTAWASGKRFAEQIGDLLSSEGASDREAAVRSIMEAAGFDPTLVKEDGALKRAAAWLGKWYQKPLEKLSDQETNNKVQAMLEIRAEHPDWNPDRVAWYVQRYIGTPDPTDRPRIAEYPLFNLFVPFWTMTVHGNHDQLVRLAGEPGQAGVQAARYVAHASLKWATNFSGPELMAYAEKRRAEGDAEAAALAEEVAAMQRAIPAFDRLSGICIPLAWADRASGKVWYLRIPSGQSVSVIDGLFLGSSARSQRQMTGSEVFDASVGQFLPRPGGPVWNAAHGAMLGVDVDRGFREISDDGASEFEAGLDRAAYVLRALTVSGAGLLPRKGRMPWSAPDAGETVDGLERALRAPGLNAALGSFLRCGNGGLRAEARILGAEERARSARAKRAAERIIAGKAGEDDWRALYEGAADPARTLKGAAKRAAAPATDPLSSALEKVPERFRADAAERHGRR